PARPFSPILAPSTPRPPPRVRTRLHFAPARASLGLRLGWQRAAHAAYTSPHPWLSRPTSSPGPEPRREDHGRGRDVLDGLFYSFFKSLVGKDVVVELKNDLSICGTLHSVDQYLNIKLTDISVTDPEKYPHMLSVKNCFIRGSVVRYVQLPADEVDTQLLQDAARKEAMQQKQ
ncbi:U6 snRNA-associated Sm-like protein LSm2, partial [Petaurus breviceps papuanus]|uniref:U6 snRNA-associated Sm-like protein LSm2 n=1 Tax=Petaurus breviceps papuanus TaxID=3040969 RepID=UPI0036DA099F